MRAREAGEHAAEQRRDVANFYDRDAERLGGLGLLTDDTEVEPQPGPAVKCDLAREPAETRHRRAAYSPRRSARTIRAPSHKVNERSATRRGHGRRSIRACRRSPSEAISSLPLASMFSASPTTISLASNVTTRSANAKAKAVAAETRKERRSKASPRRSCR